MTPESLEMHYGLPVRAWIRSGVIPAGLPPDQLEFALVLARLLRPAAENRISWHDTQAGAHRAAVAAALDAYRARRAADTTTKGDPT